MLYQILIFQYISKIFCVEFNMYPFKGYPLNGLPFFNQGVKISELLDFRVCEHLWIGPNICIYQNITRTYVYIHLQHSKLQ